METLGRRSVVNSERAEVGRCVVGLIDKHREDNDLMAGYLDIT